MRKVLWLLLSLFMIAEARENPFESAESKTVGVGKPERYFYFPETPAQLKLNACAHPCDWYHFVHAADFGFFITEWNYSASLGSFQFKSINPFYGF